MSDSRIVLIDDQQLFRDGLRTVLGANDGLVVVGEASGARDGRGVVAERRPDVVVVDIALPDVDGITLTREFAHSAPCARVLILTMHTGREHVSEALDAGARGYALKNQPAMDVVAAIRSVARGETYLAPLIAGAVESTLGARETSAAASRAAVTISLRVLSKREREVFDLVIDGASNELVARLLTISIKTVQTHRAWINRKLGAHSTADLVRIAAAWGLLSGPHRA